MFKRAKFNRCEITNSTLLANIAFLVGEIDDIFVAHFARSGKI